MQSSKPTKDSSAQRDSNHLATFFLSVAVFFFVEKLLHFFQIWIICWWWRLCTWKGSENLCRNGLCMEIKAGIVSKLSKLFCWTKQSWLIFNLSTSTIWTMTKPPNHPHCIAPFSTLKNSIKKSKQQKQNRQISYEVVKCLHLRIIFSLFLFPLFFIFFSYKFSSFIYAFIIDINYPSWQKKYVWERTENRFLRKYIK